MFLKIIIPNYNNEKYLSTCLDSILNLTFLDFKIIIVDDMSTDNSCAIILSYIVRFPDKIMLIKSTEKNFAGTCRNIGIRQDVDSDYIWFIDSDDYLPHNTCFDKLKYLVKQYNMPDMLCFQYIIDTNGKLLNSPIYNVKHCYKTGISLLNCTCAPWAKIIKTEKVRYFEDKNTFGEDAIQLLKCLDTMQDIVDTTEYLYVYRNNENSITQQIARNEKAALLELDKFLNGLEKLLGTVNKKQTKVNIVNKLFYMYKGYR